MLLSILLGKLDTCARAFQASKSLQISWHPFRIFLAIYFALQCPQILEQNFSKNRVGEEVDEKFETGHDVV